MIGIVSTTEDALQQVEKRQPDVDIRLGSENGLDLARRLTEDGCPATVILVSTQPEADFADLIAETPVADSCRNSSVGCGDPPPC